MAAPGIRHTAIWWIRRDLRLSDNPALSAALQHAAQVIPLFILDPALLGSSYSGPKRLAFLLAGLRRLQGDLAALGGRLIVRHGAPLPELHQLLVESGATAIFAEADYSPFARQRDGMIQKTLPLSLLTGLTIYPPDLIKKQDGQPYTVFTPYSKAWRALTAPQSSDLLPAPQFLRVPQDLTSVPLPAEPDLSAAIPFPAGEQEARRRLAEFTAGADPALFRYAETRNLPAVGGTSELSPYLRFGMISARQTAVAAYTAVDQAPSPDARQSAYTWLNELIWRDFYINILYHFPYVRRHSFRAQYDTIQWANDESDLRAWRQGQTGYPIVDAAMRQLLATGWMHNRTRMIAASFLVKDLLIDWRIGEQWFMQHLVDGDPAANNGGWQWTAGVGTDAAPYFRIFNPILQSMKFDPTGSYLRHWLPELAHVPEKYVHEPWTMPPAVQEDAQCRIGGNYPAPIVDHFTARDRTLAAYRSAG